MIKTIDINAENIDQMKRDAAYMMMKSAIARNKEYVC